MTATWIRHRRFAFTLTGSLLVYAVAVLLAGRLDTFARPGPLATAITLDLVLTVPLLVYFVVLRRTGRSPLRLVPLVAIGVATANGIFPPEHRATAHLLEMALIPAELALLGWIGWRAAQALRKARTGDDADPSEQFRQAAHDLLPNERVARILASELGALYYGLFSWRARPHVPEGTRAFSHHVRSGHAGVLFGLAFLLIAEGFAVHLLLAKWSPIVAWIITGSTGLALGWLVADYRATVLRPLLVGPDRFVLRAGLRWSAEVPRERVVGITTRMPSGGIRCLKVPVAVQPTCWIMLDGPIEVQGVYGTTRTVEAIGIHPDSREELVRAL